MAPGKNLRRLAIVGALVFLVASSAGAGGIVLWDWQAVDINAPGVARRAQNWSLWCYEVGSGRKLNCPYKLELRYDPWDPSDIYWNGGHMHPGRESSELAMGTLSCEGVPAKPPACEGFTDNKTVSIMHKIPQVSGALTMRATQTLPPGYRCAEPSMCDDETHTTWLLTLYTWYGIDGLVELPSSAELYVRCADTSKCLGVDNGDENHPMGFFGTPSMVAAVGKLAKEFCSLHPGKRLRLTDMSLPAGGLFDYRESWAPPHAWHRHGIDIDVANEVAVGTGGKEPLNDDHLDVLACDFTLNRYEKEEGLIHYRLEPCARPTPRPKP